MRSQAPTAAVVVMICGLALAPGSVRASSGRLPVRSYGSAEGLVGDDVRHILQDSRGYLWIATSSGISRFDGSEFVNYPATGDSLSGGVYQVLEDSRGGLWVAARDGLYRFRDTARHDQSPFERVVDRRVRCLHEDRRGVLWAGAGDSLLGIEPSGGTIAVEVHPVESPHAHDRIREVYEIAEDAEGSLWMATQWGLARRLPGGEILYYPIDPGNANEDHVHWVRTDRRGLVWIGWGHRLLVMKPDSAAGAASRVPPSLFDLALRSTPEPPEQGRAVLPDRPGETRVFGSRQGFAEQPAWGRGLQGADGAFWISTGEAVYRFEHDRFERYSEAQGLGPGLFTALAEDSHGNLWIGTFTRGLMRFARRGLTSWTTADGLLGDAVVSLLETEEDGLVVVTRGVPLADRLLALNRWDGERFHPVRPRFARDVALAGWGWNQLVVRDGDGGWWLPTGEGVFRFPPVRSVGELARTAPSEVIDHNNGLGGSRVFRLFEDSNRDIWIATFSTATLTRWKRDEDRFEVFSADRGWPSTPGDPSTTPSAFAEDSAGNLWIGLYGGGLARFSAGRFRLFGREQGLPSSLVADIVAVGADDLWVAFDWDGGLVRVRLREDGQLDLRRFTTADGLSSNRVLCIVCDDAEHMYLGTKHGVDRFDPVSGVAESFTIEDGLTNGAVTVAHRDREGALWFGTATGLSRLSPGNTATGPPARVRITDLRLNGRRAGLDHLGETEVAGLVLEPGRNRVQIGFTGIDFEPGRRLRFQHRLIGLDPDWSEPTRQRAVDYASLGPGRYVFEVRSTVTDGAPSPHVASVALVIPRPVWQRSWFLGLALLSVASGLYSAYRVRLARAVALERQRTRIAMDLHDEIGSGLGSIGLLADMAAADTTGDADRRGLVDQIGDAASELGTALGDLVSALRPGGSTLESLSRRVVERARRLFPGDSPRLHIDVPREAASLLPLPVWRNVFLIAVEALHNAARHSEAENVRMTLEPSGRRWRLTVADDGRGITAPNGSAVDSGMGLTSMRRRAREIGATLELDSSPGRGVAVSLVFDPRASDVRDGAG